jgi:hypothetical protein
VSMLPTVPPGSLLRLVAIPDRPLRVGDVVLARVREGRPLIHRIVGEQDGMYRLKGDGRVLPDPLVRRDQVVALADSVQIGARCTPMPAAPRRRLRTALRRGVAVLLQPGS